MTLSNNKIVILSILLILGVSVTAFVVGRSELFSNSNTGSANTNDIKLLAERMTRLERNVNQLTSNITNLADQKSVENQSPEIESHLHDQSRFVSIEASLQSLFSLLEEQLVSSSTPEANTQRKDAPPLSYEDLVIISKKNNEFIDDTFYNEPIEQIWSTGVTTQIGEIFYKPELQIAQVTNIDCRSTLCRADIAQPKLGSADAANFENHMLMELGKIFKGGINLRRETGINGEVNMVAYVAREGHLIPARPRNEDSSLGVGFQ